MTSDDLSVDLLALYVFFPSFHARYVWFRGQGAGCLQRATEPEKSSTYPKVKGNSTRRFFYKRGVFVNHFGNTAMHIHYIKYNLI